MIFKSGKANAGCWSFGPVLGLCAGYGNTEAVIPGLRHMED